MDVSEIPVYHGRNGPSINNRSKSIDKNRRTSRQLRRSSDMVEELKELFNQPKMIEK